MGLICERSERLAHALIGEIRNAASEAVLL